MLLSSDIPASEAKTNYLFAGAFFVFLCLFSGPLFINETRVQWSVPMCIIIGWQLQFMELIHVSISILAKAIGLPTRHR